MDLPKYVSAKKGRLRKDGSRGATLYYFHPRDIAPVRLPNPGDPAFPLEYQQARDDWESAQEAPPLQRRDIDGLIEKFKTSERFLRLKQGTRVGYVSRLRTVSDALGAFHVADLKPPHIQAMVNAMRSTPRSAQFAYMLTKMIMDYAVQMGWVETNPTTTAITLPKHTPDSHKPWPEPLFGIVESLAHPALWQTMQGLLHTGLRQVDLRRMTWDWVDDGVLFTVQEKTGRPVAIPILPGLKAHLETLPRCKGPIYKSERGRQWSLVGIRNAYGKLRKTEGLGDFEAALLQENSLHGLRSTACVNFLKAGIDPDLVREIMGHKTVEMTRIYADGEMEKARARKAAKQAMGL